MITRALLDYLLEHQIQIEKSTPIDEIPLIIPDSLVRFCRENKIKLQIRIHPEPWCIRVIRKSNKVIQMREKTVRTTEEANEFLKEAVLELNGTVIF